MHVHTCHTLAPYAWYRSKMCLCMHQCAYAHVPDVWNQCMVAELSVWVDINVSHICGVKYLLVTHDIATLVMVQTTIFVHEMESYGAHMGVVMGTPR